MRLAISFFALLLVTLTSCSEKTNSSVASTTAMRAEAITHKNIEIVKEPFENKVGREVEGVYDWWMVDGNNKYFIKIDEGKVSLAELEAAKGKKVSVSARILEGLWDTDDPNVQSRVGEYVVLNVLILP